jgi:protein SCO1
LSAGDHRSRVGRASLPAIAVAGTLLAVAAVARASTSYLPTIETAPAFTLVDTEGRAFDSSRLAGSVVLLTFVYTHCTTVCPATTAKMAAIAKLLKRERALGDGARLVSISFDSERDSPRWLKTYGESVGADERGWLFLTGTRDQLASLLGRYNFHVERTRTGDFDHPSRAYLIDASGRIRQIYSVSLLDPQRVARDIDSLLGEQKPDSAPIVKR